MTCTATRGRGLRNGRAREGRWRGSRRPIASRVGSAVSSSPTVRRRRRRSRRLYDHLDYVHALNAFLTAFPAASTRAIRQGFLDVGVEDNTVSDLLGADGFVVAVPDRERRHRLLPHDRRPERRPDGRRDAADGARHVRRHVVPVDHRLRPARAGPRRGWEVPAGPAGLRRNAPRRWLLRRPLAHEPRADARPVVHGGLAIRRRPSRRSSRRSRCTRTRRVDRAPASARSSGAVRSPPPAGRDPRDDVRRGNRPDVQHDPAERLRVLGDRATRWSRTSPPTPPTPRSSGTSPRSASTRASRSRPTTGCDASSTTRRRSGNATSRALMFDSRGEEDVALYPGSAWTNMLFGGGYLFDDADPGGHARRHQAVPADRCAQARPAHAVLLRLHRHHARDGHAPHRDSGASTSSRSSTRTRSTSTARSRTR